MLMYKAHKITKIYIHYYIIYIQLYPLSGKNSPISAYSKNLKSF